MSVTGALAAERIKLTTASSPLWSAAAVVALSVGLAVIQTATAYPGESMPPEKAALGVAVFGVPVLMVLASMTVTGEYRSGMIRTTFLATPNRTLTLAAKAVVAAVFAAACAAMTALAAIVVAGQMAVGQVGADLALTHAPVWRLVGAIALYAAVAAVLGVGVGALLRAAAGAVAVLLLWPLVVETVLSNLSDVGARVGPFLPFANAFAFTDVRWFYPGFDMRWGPWGALAYFAGVCAAVFVVAVVVVNRRDA